MLCRSNISSFACSSFYLLCFSVVFVSVLVELIRNICLGLMSNDFQSTLYRMIEIIDC